MFKKKRQEESAAREYFLQTVQSHLGYQAELLGRNKFGQKIGYDSVPWSGAFVDVCARDAALPNFPSFVNTAAGLAEAIRRGQYFRTPRPGDIAIFNFSSTSGHAAGSFNMPHCGVVTDTREFDETGRFVTIEGNTQGDTASTKNDGVHQKLRHLTDVILFYRPEFVKRRSRGKTFYQILIEIFDGARTRFTKDETDAIEEAARTPLLLKINGEIKHGTRNRRVEIIQLALATVTDLKGATPGKWDSMTAAACARFQRNIGRAGPDVTGLPDINTLRRLSKETGIFLLEEES